MPLLHSHTLTSAKLVSDESVREEAELFLHPENRMSKSISSANVTSENLLLQITVPKRTGRRRKKGSLDPFRSQPESEGSVASDRADVLYKDANYVMKSLQDNPQTCRVDIVGRINNTHRFRGKHTLDFEEISADSTSSPGLCVLKHKQ